ncbi:MAG: peptide deformylase [Candidatus Aerophobetes bacterium]|nr:peptide deformylase [Candidatus Aerophobetes bacterium]
MGIILPKQAGTKEGKLLFQKSDRVENFDRGTETVNSLKETLEHYGGVGLAAPQIGISKRVFVVNIRPTEDYPQLPQIGFRTYLNPDILTASSETNNDMEGCLSIFYATLYGAVKRSSYVRLKYLNIKGEEQIEEIDHPFWARVVLHENDHLNGKIFLQRMKKEDFSKLYWDETLDIRKEDQGLIAHQNKVKEAKR